jgi:pimeloyl-ACP methyl ester carboxylesterase
MDVILIPGLWLDATSWDEVLPVLTEAGHRVHPLALPGVGEPASSSSGIGMADWVQAVVRTIDELPADRVVVVGHSGGGNVAWGAAEQRADRIARVVLVDTIPPAPGHGISDFAVVDGVVPFPGWEFFPDEDVYDLDDATRARTAALTLSVPARVPTDEIDLAGSDRFRVPVTLLMGAMDQDAFVAASAGWGPYGEEFRAIADAEVVRIGSGHWPQFSAPQRLGELLDAAIRR